MKAPGTGQRIMLVVLATMLLALSASMAWAAVYDYTERGIVPQGVSVAGTDLSGMTEAEARTAIESAVSAPLMRPVTVTMDGRNLTFDPAGAVAVDVNGMIDAAYAPRRTAAYLDRVGHAVTGAPLTTEIEPAFTVDQAAVKKWVASQAAQVDRRAVDATLAVDVNRVKITPESTGRRTDATETVALITEAFSGDGALAASEKTLEAPVAVVPAKVTAKSFGKTIVVDLSERRIRLFKGAVIEKTYACAIGTPAHPTPKGHFEIVAKRYRPTWVNPGSEWAKTMPPFIPPGPDNPLGTRALNLSASGIRFHGTNNIGSIGSAASHGCMRMVRHDIEDLYDRVEIGTQVYIVP